MTKMLYLVGGPMGVGKTAACHELNRLLPRSVLLDGDWCWYANPSQVTQETKRMVLDNIGHLLTNFLRCSAYESVILCWVMHEREIIDAILEALPLAECQVETRIVSLVATEQELRARVECDVEAGRRDGEAVKRALSYLPRYKALGTHLIDTTGLDPREVARRVMRCPAHTELSKHPS